MARPITQKTKDKKVAVAEKHVAALQTKKDKAETVLATIGPLLSYAQATLVHVQSLPVMEGAEDDEPDDEAADAPAVEPSFA